MSVIAQLVLGGVFCGNQSNCRICILIGECWNGVDSLEILEHCRIAWRGWKVMNDWNVWNVSGATGVTGMSCKTHGCISRRSPCLLCVEFLFWSEGLFALWNVVVVLEELFCLLYVELDSGWRILWIVVLCARVELELELELEESCRASSCRIAVLEVSVKTVMSLLRMEHFLK